MSSKSISLTPLVNIVKKQVNEQKIKEFNENIKLLDIVKDFIISKKLILYGGTALNELLPKNKKFYDKTDLPDYDCFSYDAKKHSIELSKLLKNKNYQYIEVKTAIHDGTYKIYVNFLPVADFTQVSFKFFSHILQESNQQKNLIKYQKDKLLNIAPLNILKFSLYKELSSPVGSIHRWEKIYKRYKIFNSVHKLKYKNKQNDLYNIKFFEDKNILTELLKIISESKYVLVGNFAAQLYIFNNYKFEYYNINTFLSVFEILSDNYIETAKFFKNYLKYDKNKYTLEIIHRTWYNEILPQRIKLILIDKNTKEEYKLLSIIDSYNTCVSVKKINKYIIGTPFTLLKYLYSYLDVYSIYEPNKAEIYKYLIYQLENNIKNKSLDDLFSIECIGNEKTLIDVKQDKWNNKTKNFLYRP